MTNPIVDLSYWNGLPYSESPETSGIDYDKLAANISLAVLRSTIGRYDDLRYDENVAELGVRGVPVGAYHYFYPDYDVDEQVEAFNLAVDATGAVLRVVDVEADTTTLSQGQYAAAVKRFIDGAEIDTIYSSAYKWEKLIGAFGDSWVNNYKLWVAHYTLLPVPLLPKGWNTWHYWQYTKTGNGPLFGLVSASIDLNRENLVAPPPTQPPPVPPPPPACAYLRYMTVTTGSLRVRSRPSTGSGAIVGANGYGTVRAVLKEYWDGSDLWVLVWDDTTNLVGWSAMIYNGSQLAEWI